MTGYEQCYTSNCTNDLDFNNVDKLYEQKLAVIPEKETSKKKQSGTLRPGQVFLSKQGNLKSTIKRLYQIANLKTFNTCSAEMADFGVKVTKREMGIDISLNLI